MPISRKAHVKRVHQIDADGNINDDIWVDLLRVDLLPTSFAADAHDGANGQIIYVQVKWNDDIRFPALNVDGGGADIQQENANAGRWTEQMTIHNPDDPAADSDIKLWLIKIMKVKRGGQRTAVQGQDVVLAFKNGVDETIAGIGLPGSTRVSTVIKVVNNDLAGGTINVGETVEWDAYAQMLQQGSQDDSQHLDVEVTDRWKKSFAADDTFGYQGQIVIWAPANKDVELMFALGNPDAVDVNGVLCLVRTDPLQTVVNVSFGGLAVIFGPQDQNAPDPATLAMQGVGS